MQKSLSGMVVPSLDASLLHQLCDDAPRSLVAPPACRRSRISNLRTRSGSPTPSELNRILRPTGPNQLSARLMEYRDVRLPESANLVGKKKKGARRRIVATNRA
jgi:hypothetical protein